MRDLNDIVSANYNSVLDKARTALLNGNYVVVRMAGLTALSYEAFKTEAEARRAVTGADALYIPHGRSVEV